MTSWSVCFISVFLSFILYTVRQKQIFIQDDPVSQGFGLVRFAVVLAMGELLNQRNKLKDGYMCAIMISMSFPIPLFYGIIITGCKNDTMDAAR